MLRPAAGASVFFRYVAHMPSMPTILFAGGGTGGHVYPAIAIADAVRRLAPAARVIFAGTRDRVEWDAVPRAGYAIQPVTAAGIHRSLTVRNLKVPFKLAKGFLESWRLVSGYRPDAAVGTGGYVSAPVLLAATLHGVPVVLQEQNAHAGWTNRLLALSAQEVHIAFEGARAQLPAERCVLSGNPTRAELTQATRAEGRDHFGLPEGARTVFCFGGSLGSQALNAALEQHHQALLTDEHVHLLWQTGSRYYERLQARLASHPRLHLMEYVQRMDLAYAAADLVLCRAGAITCSELMVTGTPAVLVPSPNVAEDHQTKNAQSMAREGAAVLLPEPEMEDRLVELVRALLDDAGRRRAMEEAALRIARPDAAERIARHVLDAAGYDPEAGASEGDDALASPVPGASLS